MFFTTSHPGWGNRQCLLCWNSIVRWRESTASVQQHRKEQPTLPKRGQLSKPAQEMLLSPWILCSVTRLQRQRCCCLCLIIPYQSVGEMPGFGFALLPGLPKHLCAPQGRSRFSSRWKGAQKSWILPPPGPAEHRT